MGPVQIVSTAVAGAVTLVAAVLVVRIVIRLRNLPSNAKRRSRFIGSNMWQAYYVEYTILVVVICGFGIRGLRAAAGDLPYPVWAAPVSHAVGDAFHGANHRTLLNA